MKAKFLRPKQGEERLLTHGRASREIQAKAISIFYFLFGVTFPDKKVVILVHSPKKDKDLILDKRTRFTN